MFEANVASAIESRSGREAAHAKQREAEGAAWRAREAEWAEKLRMLQAANEGLTAELDALLSHHRRGSCA